MSDPARHKPSYEDIVALPEHLVGEILAGELHTHPRPSPRHARTYSALGYLVSGPFDGGRDGPGGWWILDEPELHLGADIVVPEIAGWRRERLPALPDAAWFELDEQLKPQEAVMPAAVQVVVDRIAIDDHGVPVVVLEEQGGPRWLPIWIGTAEARSIALEIEERTSPRPNSHDLARAMIRGLDASVDRVIVTELRSGTYYAVLGMAIGDRVVEIDARPSDAIALALRAQAPVFVMPEVLDQAKATKIDDDKPEEERVREWLEKARPEDLGKYKM